MRLRQVVLASTDLALTVDLLSDVLGVEVGFRDPHVSMFGLENAVFPIGETFLEVCSPVSDDAALKRWIERRGGDSGYMLIVQCDGEDEHSARVATAKGNGGKVIWEGGYDGAYGVHFHPGELGADGVVRIAGVRFIPIN